VVELSERARVVKGKGKGDQTGRRSISLRKVGNGGGGGILRMGQKERFRIGGESIRPVRKKIRQAKKKKKKTQKFGNQKGRRNRIWGETWSLMGRDDSVRKSNSRPKR